MRILKFRLSVPARKGDCTRCRHTSCQCNTSFGTSRYFADSLPKPGRIPLNLSQHISDSTEIHLWEKATPPTTFRGTIAPLILSDENLAAASRREEGKEGRREKAKWSMVYKSRRIDRDRFVTRYFTIRSSKLIRCKFMKHRFVSPMKERGWGGRVAMAVLGIFVFAQTYGNSQRRFLRAKDRWRHPFFLARQSSVSINTRVTETKHLSKYM